MSAHLLYSLQSCQKCSRNHKRFSISVDWCVVSGDVEVCDNGVLKWSTSCIFLRYEKQFLSRRKNSKFCWTHFRQERAHAGQRWKCLQPAIGDHRSQGVKQESSSCSSIVFFVLIWRWWPKCYREFQSNNWSISIYICCWILHRFFTLWKFWLSYLILVWWSDRKWHLLCAFPLKNKTDCKNNLL